MNDVELVLVFPGHRVSGLEKARPYEQNEAMKPDLVARADRLLPGMDKPGALNPASARTICEFSSHSLPADHAIHRGHT